jgi:hypothetical protein
VVSAIHLNVPFVEVENGNRSKVVDPPHVINGSFRPTREGRRDRGQRRPRLDGEQGVLLRSERTSATRVRSIAPEPAATTGSTREGSCRAQATVDPGFVRHKRTAASKVGLTLARRGAVARPADRSQPCLLGRDEAAGAFRSPCLRASFPSLLQSDALAGLGPEWSRRRSACSNRQCWQRGRQQRTRSAVSPTLRRQCQCDDQLAFAVAACGRVQPPSTVSWKIWSHSSNSSG